MDGGWVVEGERMNIYIYILIYIFYLFIFHYFSCYSPAALEAHELEGEGELVEVDG